MSGTLYLCATPIGNLSDMTDRVKETLENVSLIAAEDTRNSLKLLNRFDIHTPMTSFHEHNRFEKAPELIAKLKAGEDIALITDAGTPAISDPGENLVHECHKEGIKVTSLPGACALITGLTLSGMSARRFCFEGFLPVESKERNYILNELKDEKRTIILYEAPHKLKKTLSDLKASLGDRAITLCRELTKIHEEAIVTTLEDAIAKYDKTEPKGEYVLVIEGKSREEILEEEKEAWSGLSIEEHVKLYEAGGSDRKEAMKAVAKDRGISKRDVYQYLLKSVDKAGDDFV